MKQLKRRLLMLALVIFCLTPTALAYDAIEDLDRTCTLTIDSQQVGVTYDVYRVCEVDELAHFTPCGAFADSSIRRSIENLIASSKWTRLVTTLTGWLSGRDANGQPVPPVKTEATKENGQKIQAVFTDLPVGLYLVRGRTLQTIEGSFVPESFLICLPNWEKPGVPGTSSGEGEWNYNVNVVNKGHNITEDTTSREVLKEWRGDGNISRPASVTVRLIRTDRKTGQSRPYDTVTLSKENGWNYRWEDLDVLNYEWTFEEVDAPGAYAVEYRQEGIQFVITNRYSPDDPKNDPDPDPPKDPGKPKDPNDPNDPDDPDTPKHDPDPDPDPGTPVTPPDGPPNIPDEELEDPDTPLSRPPEDEDWEPYDEEDWDPEDEEEIDDEDPPLARLPQTGVLWWPVPFLAMGGMFLFVLGWALNRRAQRDEE